MYKWLWIFFFGLFALANLLCLFFTRFDAVSILNGVVAIYCGCRVYELVASTPEDKPPIQEE